jgi:hypothetical protein
MPVPGHYDPNLRYRPAERNESQNSSHHKFKIPKNRKINTSDRNSRITAFCADGQCVVWQVSASAWVSARFVASGLEIVRED